MLIMNWKTLASDAVLELTINNLKNNGISAIVVENKEEAKAKFIELVPKGSEVMDMTSTTLLEIGIPQQVNDLGIFDSVKNKLTNMDRATQGREMQKIGAAPEWTTGSVHAITEAGAVVIASNTGSQLAAYAYGADHIIWVVGTQKIVKDLETGLKRIYEYVLPLEAERARKAYGAKGSNVSKLLVINKEVKPERITIIFVKEVLGF